MLAIGLAACETENNTTTPNPSPSVQEIDDYMKSANGLRIALFIEEGENETYLFDDYRFVFGADSSVTATKPGETIVGSYAVFRDDGRTELLMRFPGSPAFSELNDDWYFISRAGNTVRFEDSGDILEFEPY